MTPDELAAVTASIRDHEGFAATPQPDAHGTVVIGYGRNLNTDPLSHEEADYLLAHGLSQRSATLSMAWPVWMTCDGPRKRVLLEMAYQLGVNGLLGFPKLLHAITVHDYQAAAEEVLHSHLAAQTPARARDYAELLRS